MDLSRFEEILERVKKFFDAGHPTRMTPSDIECEDLRATMRGQFKQLKAKGLSIRIITL